MAKKKPKKNNRQVRVPPMVHVSPHHVDVMTGNPNVMDADEYVRLKAGITKFGFMQPLLVTARDDSEYSDGDVVTEEAAKEVEALLGLSPFVLVDGEHRLQVAKELGLEHVPAMVIKDGEDVGRALRIAMNRIRGQVNLTAVARELDELIRDHGWTADDVEVAGFSNAEVHRLLESIQDVDPVLDALADAGDVDEPTLEEDHPRGYAIRLVFETEAQRARVKAALLAAAGDGGTMAGGLIAMIGGSS